MRPGFLVHPRARVGHLQQDVGTRGGLQVPGRRLGTKLHVGRPQGENSPFGHGVPGVHRQVHQHLLELGGVHPNQTQVLPGAETDLHVLPQKTVEQTEAFLDPFVQVHHLGVQGLAAAEGQKLAGEVRGPAPQTLHLLQIPNRPLLPLQLPPGQFRVAQDARQQVVEIVGHPSRQAPHGLHLLGLEELVLQARPETVRLHPGGLVRQHGEGPAETPLFVLHGGSGDMGPEAFPVPAPEAAFVPLSPPRPPHLVAEPLILPVLREEELLHGTAQEFLLLFVTQHLAEPRVRQDHPKTLVQGTDSLQGSLHDAPIALLAGPEIPFQLVPMAVELGFPAVPHRQPPQGQGQDQKPRSPQKKPHLLPQGAKDLVPRDRDLHQPGEPREVRPGHQSVLLPRPSLLRGEGKAQPHPPPGVGKGQGIQHPPEELTGIQEVEHEPSRRGLHPFPHQGDSQDHRGFLRGASQIHQAGFRSSPKPCQNLRHPVRREHPAPHLQAGMSRRIQQDRPSVVEHPTPQLQPSRQEMEGIGGGFSSQEG